MAGMTYIFKEVLAIFLCLMYDLLYPEMHSSGPFLKIRGTMLRMPICLSGRASPLILKGAFYGIVLFCTSRKGRQAEE